MREIQSNRLGIRKPLNEGVFLRLPIDRGSYPCRHAIEMNNEIMCRHVVMFRRGFGNDFELSPLRWDDTQLFPEFTDQRLLGLLIELDMSPKHISDIGPECPLGRAPAKQNTISLDNESRNKVMNHMRFS